MSDVAIFGGDVKMKSSAELAKAMREELNDTPANVSGDGEFISFSGKSGRYAIGAEKRETDPDELFIVNIHDFKSGWMCWKGGAPVAKRLAGDDEPRVMTPDMNEFGPFGESEGWSAARSMSLISLDTGTQYFFSTSSGSGVRAFRDLKELATARGERGDAAWPVFSLSSDTFKGQGYDIPKPKFDIDGWIDDENITEVKVGADLDALYEASAVQEVEKIESPKGGTTRRRRTL